MLLLSFRVVIRPVRGWFLTGEMLELINEGVTNIICAQPFACLPNHIVGKGVIKRIRHDHPDANIVAIDYDPGASEVNQLNRIKLMLSTAQKKLKSKKLRPCIHAWALWFSYAILQTLSSFVYAGKGKKPRLRRVLSLITFYFYMCICCSLHSLICLLARTNALKSHHIGYTSSALHFPVYSSA